MSDMTRLFDLAYQAADDRSYTIALLGKHNPDDTVDFEVVGRPDYLYVTIPGQTPTIARNEAGVAQEPDGQVKLRHDHKSWVIAGRSTSGTHSVPTPTPASGVLPHTLEEHSDVNTTPPASGDVLQFNDFDGLWSPVAPSALGLTLDDLNGVTVPTPAEGDLLEYSGGDWINAATVPTAVAATIHGATGKTTPIDADEYALIDTAASNALKKVTGTNLKAYLKTYFDTLYDLTGAAITALATKTTPVDADDIVITDSAASNAPKRVTGTNYKAYLKTYFDTLYDALGAAAAAVATHAALTVTHGATGAIVGTTNAQSLTSKTLDSTNIASLTGKTTPVDADSVVIVDSAASNVFKAVTGTNWKAYMVTYFSTLYAVLAGTAGGQVLNGGNAANDDLTLRATAHATKTSAYLILNDTGGKVVIGSATPGSGLFGIRGVPASTYGFETETDSAGRGFQVVTTDYVNGSAGSALVMQLANGTGDVAAYLNAFTVGKTAAAVLALQHLSGGGVSIGQSANAAQLDVLQATLGSIVLRLASTATNDDPTEDVIHGRAATTNATVTTVLTIPIAASNTYWIEADVIARRTGGSAGAADDAGGGKIWSVYKTAGGTVTLVAAPAFTGGNDFGVGGAIMTLVISGTNILVRVTGNTNYNISWHVFAKVRKVGS